MTCLKQKQNLPALIKNKSFIFLIAVVCLETAFFSVFFLRPYLQGKTGWDFNIYCAAGQAIVHHQNPYLVSVLNNWFKTSFSFCYPPLSPFLFYPLWSSSRLYVFAFLILLTVSFLLISRDQKNFINKLLYFAIILGGYLGTFWSFRTGNIGLLDLFIFTLIILAVRKSNYLFAGILCGFLAYAKIQPLILLIVPFFMNIELKQKVICLLAGFIVLLLLHIISFILLPDIYPSFWIQIIGGYPGQHSPAIELKADWYNPSMILVFKNINDSFTARLFPALNHYWLNMITVLMYLSIISFLGSLFISFRKNVRDQFLIFCFGCLLLFLIGPRTKPYSFTLVLLPTYYLIRSYSFLRKVVMLFIIIIFPMICYIVPHFGYLFINRLCRSWAVLVSITGLHQLIFLIVAYLFIFYFTVIKINNKTKLSRSA